jgi:hypothetical protein
MTATATQDLTTLTPREVDEMLADLCRAEEQAGRAAQRAMIGLHDALGERQIYTGRNGKFTYARSDADTLAAARARGDEHCLTRSKSYSVLVADFDEAVKAAKAADAAQKPYHDEYARRPWSRFFFVRGGHIHSDLTTRCNRRYDTDQGWNPALSGKSEAEAVAELGPNLCTKCYPTAPVEWKAGTVRKTREQIAEEKAAAAEQARVTDPKLIAAPDGSELRVDGDTLRTVRSADIAAVDHLVWAAYGRHTGEPNEPYAAGHEAHTRTIVAALAAKAGTTEAAELARITAKALAKIRKELGADVAAAAAARWAA